VFRFFFQKVRNGKGRAESSEVFFCDIVFNEMELEGTRKGKRKLRRPSRPRFLIVVFPWDEGQMPRRGLEVSLLLREIP